MGWKTVVFFVLVIGSAGAFVGKDSTEARLKFSHRVSIAQPVSQEVSQANVEEQLLYLFGSMAAAKVYGIPKGEHQISVKDPMPLEDGTWAVPYEYDGNVQLKRGPLKHYEVALPRQTDQDFIYDRRCTDETYPDFPDFWYFWNPNQEGCSLEEGFHYDRITADIKRMANSQTTYPEYRRLMDKKTGEVLIYVFIGMDDGAHERNPLHSREQNSFAYRAVRARLLELGFEGELLPGDEMRRILNKRKFWRPYVETFRLETEKVPIEVRLFFGPTAMDEASSAFHYFYKEANEKASVLIYDGHSGDGETLDLKAIEKKQGFQFALDESRYQILFFNSCTSYTYYNSIYFYRKQGNVLRRFSKNLDLLTNGLPTYFDDKQIPNLALIEAVVSWANGGHIQSYQALAKLMDSGNLFGVNGDEDNPTRAADVR